MRRAEEIQSFNGALITIDEFADIKSVLLSQARTPPLLSLTLSLKTLLFAKNKRRNWTRCKVYKGKEDQNPNKMKNPTVVVTVKSKDQESMATITL